MGVGLQIGLWLGNADTAYFMTVTSKKVIGGFRITYYIDTV